MAKIISMKVKGLTPKVRAARIRLAMRHPNSAYTASHIIGEALKHKVYLAFSGGRCSTVALHLTLKQDPDIPVVFNNTGIEYPETVKYTREIAEKWDLNFHELKPEHNFWDLVKEHGFPQLRGSPAKKTRRRKPICCKLLKEAPGNKFRKANDLEGFITGIRVEESRPRALGVFQTGPYYLAKRDGIWKAHPVALWSIERLMEYVDIHDIPLNPLYAMGYTRVGCMPCTGFTSWRAQLQEHKPRFYKWLNREYQKSVGEPTLWEYEDFNDCRQEPML